jgi:transglycosylase-like protein with SLT domain
VLERIVGIAFFVCACNPPSRERERPPLEGEQPARARDVTIAWLPVTVARHRDVFRAAAEAHAIDPELLAIVTLVESGGWTKARSPSGARGLMQIMPSTARHIAETRGQRYDGGELEDPEHNVDLGAWYFSRQLADFATIELAAAAYNAGPGALRLHLEEQNPLSPQTVRYQSWILGMWDERDNKTSPTLNAWIRAGGDRLLARAQAEMSTAP